MKKYYTRVMEDLVSSTPLSVAVALAFNRLHTAFKLLMASMFFVLSVSAQYAPDSLVIPTKIRWTGVCNDSWDGVINEGEEVTVISPSAIYTASKVLGTYNYTKTDSNTATLTYTRNEITFTGDNETEQGTVDIVFTSPSGGTYTSSGDYFGVESGADYTGYWVDGAGTFTYTPLTNDYAPNSLPSTSKFNWAGTCLDSWDGLINEGENITAGPDNTYTAVNVTGTYHYTKTGPNLAVLNYTRNWTSPTGDSETENGTVNIVFTSASGGIYTSEGFYTGVELGEAYDGSWSNGEGVFTYTPSTYPVTYSANGANGGAAPSSQLKTNDVSLKLRANTGNLVRTGYAFGGWNTLANGSGTSYAAGGTYLENSAVTMYALWISNAYEIRYDANGATSGEAPPSQIKTNGVTLKLAGNIGGLARTGYTFSGWNTSSNGTGTSYATNASYTANAALKLYARWTANRYTVTYGGNGNTGGTTTNSVHTYNVRSALTVNGYTRTGHSFAGWSASPLGGVVFTNRQSVLNLTNAQGATVPLYAVWTANVYTVTFNAAGGTVVPASIKMTSGQVYGELPTPQRPGYIFGGWWTVSGGTGTQVTSGSVFNNNSNLTLYAKWTMAPKYTLAVNGGSGGGLYPAGSIVQIAPNTPPAGKIFFRWTDESGNLIFDVYQGRNASASFVMPDGDVTLVAEYISPRSISTLEELHRIGNDPEYPLDGGYVLTADIDATGVFVGEIRYDILSPIGNGEVPFTGLFDGRGHTIRGLNVVRAINIENPSQSDVGLFGCLYEGVIRNLRLVDCQVEGTQSVGGLVGSNVGIVEGCHFVGLASVWGDSLVGGLVGVNDGVIRDSSAMCDVSGVNDVGGLLGRNCCGTVQRCFAGGAVTGLNSVGGLAGYNRMLVEACCATGPVTGTSTEENWLEGAGIGGLVGFNDGGVSECYAAGTVMGGYISTGVGGLAGMNRNGHIQNCYATGHVEGCVAVGRLVGLNGEMDVDSYGSVKQCYAVGSANEYCAASEPGLIGDGTNVTSCSYWDYIAGAWSQEDLPGDAAARTTAQMRQQATYVGWDFVSVWSIKAGLDYPKLRALASCRLSFDSAGGSAVSSTNVIVNNAYGTLPTPVRAGFTFGGWWTGAEGAGTRVTSTTVVQTFANHTLYAKWSAIQYIVTFDAAGGTVSTTSVKVVNGQPYGALPTPTRAGYLFKGWWTGTGGTGTEVFPETLVTKTVNHTLYAKWLAIPKLTVVGGGIEGETSNAAFVLPGEERQIYAGAALAGKVFDRWTVFPTTANLGPGFNASEETTTVVMPSVSVTLTAVYIAIPKLTVIGGGIEGETSNAALVLPGEERQVYAGAPLTGKVFDRWTVSPTTANLGPGFNASEEATTVVMPSVSVTLTAVYIAIPKLTVIGGGIEGETSNAALVLPGEERLVMANELVGKVFEKWSVSPATANLGEVFNPRSPNPTIRMPSVSVTLTAVYVYAPGFIGVNVDSTLPGMEVSGILWSIDKITWVPVNDGNVYPVKPGTYTNTFKTTNSRWLAPPSQIVKVVFDTVSEVNAVATYVPLVSWQLSSDSAWGSGMVTLSPTNGQVLPGKGVTLTAKPATGFVFVGWEGLVDMPLGSERKPTLTVYPTEDAMYTVRFRAQSDCERPEIRISQSTECMVGVAYSALVEVNDGALPVKFSAINLPPGLKMDSVTGLISGVPTKPGTSNVTINASNVKGTAVPQVYAFSVVPLPVWAWGTFNGMVWNGDLGEGSASMSVTSLGGISGKYMLRGTNYSFSAPSYEARDEKGMLSLITTAKVGSVWCLLTMNVDTAGVEPATLSRADGMLENGGMTLYRSVWKDPGMAAVLTNNYTGYYTATLQPREEGFGSGYLTFTVDKVGGVVTAGKLADGTAVSLSGPLILDDLGRVFTVLYTAPAAYRGGCLFGAAEFYRGIVEGAPVTVRALDGLLLWESRNPAATWIYGAGFLRFPGLSGGYYDKLINLRAYYENGLVVSGVQTPSPLLAAVKMTDFDPESTQEPPAKISWTQTVLVDPAGASPNGLILSVTPDTGVGTGLVAPAVRTPVKVFDPETGEWIYNYNDLENPSGLTNAFTRATGIFKGGFNVYYDYASASDLTTGLNTWAHVVKKAAYEGALTPVRGEGEPAEGRGFILWQDVGFYDSGRVDINGEPIMTSFLYNLSYDFLLFAY